MIRIIAMLCLLPFMAFSQTPIDIQKWDIGGGKIRTQVGGPPRNYDSAGTWRQIENNWVTVDDTLHTARNAILKTDVNNSGQVYTSVILGDDTVTIAQRLLSLKWFRKSDSAWLNIDNTPSWSTPSVVDDQIKWTNVFPAVDVTVGKYEGQVDHAIHFKPAFLDSAVALFNQRADSADIYLANVIAVELVGVADADSSLGTITKRKLKKLGNYILDFDGSFLELPISRDDPHIRIHQRHIIKNGKLYMLELVKMSKLKWAHETYPTETLWHRASTKIEQPSVEDCGGREDASNSYGGAKSFTIWGDLGSSNVRMFWLRAFNLDSLVTGTRTDCSLYVHVLTLTHRGVMEIYRLYKPWWIEGVETGVAGITEGVEEGSNCWNWDNNASLNWTDNPIACQRENGVDNVQDAGPCNQDVRADRDVTYDDAVTYTATGKTPLQYNTNPITGDSINVVLVPATPDETDELDMLIVTTEGNNSANRPYFIFITEAAEGGDISYVRRIKEGEGK